MDDFSNPHKKLCDALKRQAKLMTERFIVSTGTTAKVEDDIGWRASELIEEQARKIAELEWKLNCEGM